MGTTSQKIAYLKETKNQIKNAITEQGIEVLPTDSFRSYANHIRNISSTDSSNSIKFINICPKSFSEWESGQYGVTGNKGAYASRIRLVDLLPIKSNHYYHLNTGNSSIQFTIRQMKSDGTLLVDSGSFRNASYLKSEAEAAFFAVSLYGASSMTYSDYQSAFADKTIEPEILESNITNSTQEINISDYFILDTGLADFDDYGGNVISECLKKFPLELDFEDKMSMDEAFDSCINLEEIPDINSSSATSMMRMFGYCRSLKKIGQVNCKMCDYIYNMFIGDDFLEEIGGLLNLGESFTESHILDLSYTNLTTGSYINIFNSLYNISSKGMTSTILISNPSYSHPSEEEIAIATNKGWTITYK